METSPDSFGARRVAVWIGFGTLIGIACGFSSAVFLLLLDLATHFRTGHRWIVWTLPVAGLGIGWIYDRWGRRVRAGSNLVLDTIHGAEAGIPTRMAPMVLVGTVLTHLFGGSAGREGTAVQMGGSLADRIAIGFKVRGPVRAELIAAGMAGGFGSVFGTPLAGAIFGIEAAAIGRLHWAALVPGLVAALVGDRVVHWLGIAHTHYPRPEVWTLGLVELGKWMLFALLMAGAALLFVELTHRLKANLEKRLPSLPWRMFAGGVAVVMLWQLVGADDYLGLGIPGIVNAFSAPPPGWEVFLLKILFTAVTLASGFLGGEVTPLFFIGATLGAAASGWLGIPQELAAGVGLAAVFAAAANAPIALSVMCIELLGLNMFPHVLIVCGLAWILTGHRGIYSSQRVFRRKLTFRAEPARPRLGELP